MPTVGVRPAGSGEDVQAACQLARRQNTLEYEGLLITLVKKQQGVSGWVFQTKKNWQLYQNLVAIPHPAKLRLYSTSRLSQCKHLDSDM